VISGWRCAATWRGRTCGRRRLLDRGAAAYQSPERLKERRPPENDPDHRREDERQADDGHGGRVSTASLMVEGTAAMAGRHVTFEGRCYGEATSMMHNANAGKRGGGRSIDAAGGVLES